MSQAAQAHPTEHHQTNTAAVVRITTVAAFGGLLFGYDSAVINGAVSSIQSTFDVGPGPLGFAVAAALLGAAVGAFFGSRIADRTGRIPVMKVAALLFLLSAIGCGLTQSIEWLIFWRVIGGVGVGVASVIAPAYIAEVSPAHLRGRLGSLQQMGIVLGIFLSLLVDALLANWAGGASQELWLGLAAWRWMFLIMAVPALLYGIGSFLIPESPRFLVAAGREDEARSVLSRIHGDDAVDVRVDKIRTTVNNERKPRFSDLRGSMAGLKPVVWVGIGLAALQQFVGINVIFYYSNTLWESVGFKESDSFAISVATSVVNVLVTIVAIFLVDKVGRRPLLLVGSGGMAVTLGVMSFVFATAGKEMVDGQLTPVLGPVAGPVALVAANLFVVFFGVSWGPLMWVLLGEMFPNHIRGAALAVAGAVQWLANWAVTVSFPTMSNHSLGLTYGIYALFAAVSLVFTIKMVRETNNVELEDMHD
ncbi:sugar porter family MFS transporter [Kocuria rhizophila]|uniref:sugar porter family MFS transporter n=1 Tax=Kocuria rhizophila TaxID=72000 RepID=UPI0021504AF4|nr:sugar porter family MFS transporter [Kocuria rhizophila]MCR4525525.1 sugar porter family MFS transporter [Kocuria rhizophila]MDA4827613.1 sugar porter family MFS transporter [Kocuria rhizophila]WSQ03985.1 sugar porter family MFS transporter [Kocuria rhizophila]WSY87926.1 sugar porter family MFS transporter [Kocuria rhizophila]WSZ53352.1 sugar porter family MFS transporter [Kocuria rhizophila]